MTSRFRTTIEGYLQRALLALLVLVFAACGKPKEEKKEEQQVKRDTVQIEKPPFEEKRLNFRVVYPESGQPRPGVDSNFIFGSVGVPYAHLTINGYPVPVAPSGGFLAFLPMPSNGVYMLRAQVGTEVDSFTHAYGAPPLPSSNGTATPAVYQRFMGSQRATIVTGSDTLATGSDVTGGSPALNTDRKWFFPRGAVLTALGRQGNQVQVALSDNTNAWVPDTSIRIDSGAIGSLTGAQTAGMPSFNSYPGYIDVRVTSGFAPFLVEQSDRQITLTLYGLTSPSNVTGGNMLDSVIADVNWSATSQDATKLNILLQQPVWGFKAFYDRDGAVVLRVRRPPVINMLSPLAGRRILIDAGHPPQGATGPTGLKESEANLAIALPLAQKLRGKGATVIMTRTNDQAPRSMTNSALDLWYRAEMAVTNDAEILISVHNNAFGDGVNPFRGMGTSTYYYHSHSRELAWTMQNSILRVTGLPDKLANQRSLALVRPTWMPSVLTESMYMMFPEQEMLLRDPEFLNRLAQAHVEGLEIFLLNRAQQAAMPRIEK